MRRELRDRAAALLRASTGMAERAHGAAGERRPPGRVRIGDGSLPAVLRAARARRPLLRAVRRAHRDRSGARVTSGAAATGLRGAPVVSAAGLAKRFGPVAALDGVDLEVAAGAVLAVLGPNGAGKTTLLRLLAGLARPSAGSVLVRRAAPIAAARAHASATSATRRSCIPQLTARENLLFAARLYGVANAGARIDALLAEQGLDARRRSRRRLVLARAWPSASRSRARSSTTRSWCCSTSPSRASTRAPPIASRRASQRCAAPAARSCS